MQITDQPGRFLAVLVFGPLLIYKGNRFNDIFLVIFGFLLIFYDLFWIINYPSKKINI